ncbi:lantibiotic dehydratase family protein [Chitinophaga pendula]|uniref:lantibiotic dehydratase n=1 Tax=Chitinophaga TaxID=79328 RepID=UPI000BAEAF12|nr:MULTISPECIES: lantibiotic dehydratase [Chitinophaga]ASZ12713.1 hypothetical protein CK934_18000 [Chitinophaga sp. MD30]UCJ09671.1 lantibiotic dehydratase family protein [Chitinophaga pendula]
MRVKIFPYAFARYTTIHQQHFEALLLADIPVQLTAMANLSARITQSKEAACELLYHNIQSQNNDADRQPLIRLKRLVFNTRLPDEHLLQTVIPQLPDTTQRALKEYLDLVHQQQQLTSSWQQHFDEQLTRHRQSIQQLSTNPLLENGLLLSSPVLFDQLPSFRKRPADNFRHKEVKNEYSLLRYLSRMAFKTSPFSTFTYTGIAEINNTDTALTIPHPETIKSGVRLNNALFTYLQSLMVHHPALNEILLVRLNNTTIRHDNHLQFLVNCFNIEAFQRMPAAGIALWLFHTLEEQSATQLTLKELIATLGNAMADADRESIKSFLLKLIRAGLLEASTGCSGISPEWDLALIFFLRQCREEHPQVIPLCNVLEELHAIRETYTTASPVQRRPLLQKAADSLNHTLNILHQQAGFPTADPGQQETGKEALIRQQLEATTFETNVFSPRYFQPANIFYEDASTPEVATLPANSLQPLVEKIDQLCQAIACLDDLQDERDAMRNFFRKHYQDNDTVPITTFYHDYYLQEKKKSKETTAQKASPNRRSVSPENKQLLLQYLDIQYNSKSVVNICPQPRSAKITTPASPAAKAVFAQLFTTSVDNSCRLQAVINNFLPGMGKVAGRFLDLFDPAITNTFREWNNRLHQDTVLMELSDGSSFNANIHPPLLACEIRIPGGHNNYPATQQAQLQDIVVAYDNNNKALYLHHLTSGKRIYAFDLCLESFYMRSNFYQLLAHFNPEQHIPVRRFVHMLDETHLHLHPSGAAGILYKPRIVYADDVIIRRKGWLMDVAIIPTQGKEETEAGFLLRLNQWRISHDIPEQVFLVLRTHYNTIPLTDKNELQRDDYKPQYIHFYNPLLVMLWKKLLSRADKQIYVEEMLPHTADLNQPTSSLPVTEHLLHWYKY